MSGAPAWRFAIVATPCPQLSLRVLGLFAQQDLIPCTIAIRCVQDTLDIVLTQQGLEPQQAEILAQKIRAMVLVTAVECERIER